MEYQKIINLSDQPSKFRTRNWAEITDESKGVQVQVVKLNLNFQ